jgi:hypothetical protein
MWRGLRHGEFNWLRQPANSGVSTLEVTMEFELLQATESDRDYLLELRKLTMTEHLENSGQFLSEREHKIRLGHKYDCSYLVLYNGEIVGTLKYESTDKTVEISKSRVWKRYYSTSFK